MSRHSEIWDYFEICVTDVSRARCTICNTSLSRRGKTAFNTTNLCKRYLRKHLRSTHGDKWRELLDKEQRNASKKMFLSSHQHSQHQHHINNQHYQPCREMESHRFTCLDCPLSYRHERGLRSHYLIDMRHSGPFVYPRLLESRRQAAVRARLNPRRRRARAAAA